MTNQPTTNQPVTNDANHEAERPGHEADRPDVVDLPQHDRYELRLSGTRIGLADYDVKGDVVTVTHTEVDPSHGGKGYASILVRRVLDDVRAQDKKVVAQCSYVDSWITKHPDYEDLRA